MKMLNISLLTLLTVFVVIQQEIDDRSISGRLPLIEGEEFQSGLDSIRRDYLQMTEAGRFIMCEERADIARRLNSLEMGINRLR
jgi:hypothetical protein